MRIQVKVIAHASRDAIEELGSDRYKVWVKALPEKGRANQAVIKLLALNFGVGRSAIKLVLGATSSQKIFEILT